MFICNGIFSINIANNPNNQGLFFDVKPGIYDIWAIEYGYSTYKNLKDEKESLYRILSRSTEKELAFANDV